MSNINDYLLWRGDLKISNEFPFNEIDSMILARFSYLRMDKIKIKSKETIESISNKMKDFSNDEFLYNGDKELITNLGKSLRFKDMLVTNYIKTENKENEKQFGAVTIHISEREMYVSYIGTNSTINGWKEDANMAFMDNVPCQIEGKKYLERVAHEFLGKKIRVGGHSKGGNVAIYSSISVSKNIANRIIKVYNYDGPGFNSKIIEKYKKNDVLKKIVTYIPQESVIGRMLKHEEECEVVLSIEKGIYQHDIYSWQVLKDNIIKNDGLTDSSEIVNKVLNEWLIATTNEQRKIFFDSIFQLFFSTEANTFSEIQKNLSANIMIILKTYNIISKEDKRIITKMIKLFTKTYLEVIKEMETNKINDTIQRYKLQNIQIKSGN